MGRQALAPVSNIEDYRRTETNEETTSTSGLSGDRSATYRSEALDEEPVVKGRSGEYLEPGDLYRGELPSETRFSQALRLLEEGAGLIEEAQREAREGNPLVADDLLQQSHLVLREAFCLREIGAGYSMAINGLLQAYRNKAFPLEDASSPSVLFTKKEMTALLATVRRVLREPRMAEETALDCLEIVQKAGLTPVSAAVELLLDGWE